MASSLENRLSVLERQLDQLSAEIDQSIAKDQELLARLRSAQGVWRALRRMREQDISVGDPYDESSVATAVTVNEPPTRLFPNQLPKEGSCSVAAKQRQHGDSSALTDQAVALSERSVSDQNKEKSHAFRDTNSI